MQSGSIFGYDSDGVICCSQAQSGYKPSLEYITHQHTEADSLTYDRHTHTLNLCSLTGELSQNMKRIFLKLNPFGESGVTSHFLETSNIRAARTVC